MTRYQSGRNKDIKVGIPSYTEDKTVIDVIGKVGIGTTFATRDLDINGDIKIRGGIYDKDDDFGALNYVIAASGNGEWNWLPISSLSGDIPGITVRYNNSVVGSGSSIKTLNFIARNTNLNVSGDAGIATITSLNTPWFDSIQVTGISTFNNGKVLVGGTDPLLTDQIFQVYGSAYISTSVGIGTTNAVNNLQVFGGITAGNATSSTLQSGYSILRPNDSTPRTFAIVEDDTNLRIGGDAWNAVNIRTAPSNEVRVAITSAGNVGVGTTNPTNRFEVLGNSRFNGAVTLLNNPTGVGFGTTTTLPSYYIGQTMGDSDAWKIYGESPNGTNTGTLVFEVNDDVDNSERFLFRSRRTNSPSIGGTSLFELTQNGNIIQYVPLLIGSATTTGTAEQPLQVTGGAYVRDKLGIGITNPVATLQVKDTLAFETTNTTTSSTSQVVIDSFSIATFRSAKYHVQITCPGQISTLGGITTGGRGYTAGTFNITFTTFSGTGAAAQGTLTVSNGTIGALSIISGGSGYNTGDILTASGGSGLQVSVASTSSPTGAILTLGSITSAGIGYTAGVGVGTTTIAFLGGTGTSATGLATIFDGVVTSATLLQQMTTGTGGTIFYSGSNYSTTSVLSVNKTSLINTIITITTSGTSTFTSLTKHGLSVNDIIRSSSTSNGLTAGTDYYVVSVPSTTTFTLGTSLGVAAAFTAGTSLSIGFYRNSANAGGTVAFTNAIAGVSTNYQVSDLLVLQNENTVDYVEYAGIANNDILGTFGASISGGNAQLLLTPTYGTNIVKVARQVMTI